MSATNANSVLETLELDTALIDSLPESVLSELIGFIEYDGRLRREQEAPSRLVASGRDEELAGSTSSEIAGRPPSPAISVQVVRPR